MECKSFRERLVVQLWAKCVMIFNICLLVLGSQGIQLENAHKWAVEVARYLLYMLIIKGSHELCVFGYNQFYTRNAVNFNTIWKHTKIYVAMFVASYVLIVYNKQTVLNEGFLLMFIGYLIVKYPEMDTKPPTINYGMGMAYSFFEGYLAHIIPSDGAKFVGFEENINVYEAKQQVRFPVKKLFIVITKSLFCPPDLKHFNKSQEDLPYLEACQSLEEVEKDVAGVKQRIYRNSAYKIHRRGKSPVLLAAECATPLHTLHRVLQKKALYDDLCEVEPSDLVRDFCATLRSIIHKNPESRGKCELIFYNDEDPKQNLADVLLDKIRELEPDFEKIITQKD